MNSPSFSPLDSKIENLIKGRYQSLLLSCREILEQGATPERRLALHAQLDSYYSPNDGVCSFCHGTGIDNDPGMTRFYSEKSLRGQGYVAPEEEVTQSNEEIEELKKRSWGDDYQRLLDDAWDVVASEDEHLAWRLDLLAGLIEHASATEASLTLSQAEEGMRGRTTICDTCQGSGSRTEEGYVDPWGERHGWTKSLLG
jgi:hypothetical protein